MIENMNVLSQIEKDFLSMSEVEKKIGDYILHNPEKVVNTTMRVLSQEVGVSEGSIVNFSNKLGFDGFTRLKIGIAQSLGRHKYHLLDEVDDRDSPKDAMKKTMDNAIASFQSTYNAIHPDELQKAIDLIMNTKKRIEFYGVSTSSILANDAYYRFRYLGLQGAAVTDAFMLPVSASMLDEDCLAVAFSHTGRTDEIVDSMKIAKSQGAKTMCITSYSGGALAQLCDVSLVAISKEATQIHGLPVSSRLTHLLLMDTLCAYINAKQKDTMLEKRSISNEIMDRHYQHY